MAVASLDLDLEVFQGPFDLLLTLVLREEVDLLEVELADVVVAYIDHLQAKGEIDLEAATEFLVLIAALLELKSRLMLPVEETDGLELEPSEAADELLARMLEYRRYRDVAGFLRERLEAESGFRYRSARAAARTCGGCRWRWPRPPTSPTSWPRRWAACCASRPRSTCATSRARACRWSSAWPTCAACCAAGPRSPSTTPSRAPTA